MAVNFNWFIKFTRSSDPDFRFKIAKPEVRLIMIENKSEQTFLPDLIKEHFGFEWGLIHCLLLFFSIVSTMFIMTISVALMAWPSRDADIVFLIPIPIPTQRQHLLLHVVIFGAMLTPGFFPFFSIDWVENSIVPFEISIASSLCWASFRSTVRSTQGNKSSQHRCSSHSMIAPGSSQLCAFSCK
jgi:hypothetical protein